MGDLFLGPPAAYRGADGQEVGVLADACRCGGGSGGPGGSFTTYASGDLRATGMSFFSVGGNAGFAAAPVLATLLLLGPCGGWLTGLPQPGPQAEGAIGSSNQWGA